MYIFIYIVFFYISLFILIYWNWNEKVCKYVFMYVCMRTFSFDSREGEGKESERLKRIEEHAKRMKDLVDKGRKEVRTWG